MEHSYDEWITNANEALEISLVQSAPTGLRAVASFHPKFTYAVFGDEETIVGYQDLAIRLRFHASDMRPNLLVSSSRKLKAVGEHEATDIPAALKDFLPPVAFQKPAEFETAVQQAAAAAYTPPGERVRTLTGSDGRYEIWKGTLADAAVKQLVNRVQILVPLFIEGGTLISTDGAHDPLDRWTVFFLYRTRQRSGTADAYDYEFAGYATVYRFLLPVGVAAATPPRTEGGEAAEGGERELELELPAAGESAFALAKLPCRSRISQFLILPPFQGKGNAGRLYRTIFDDYLREPQTTEITVEDPNEAFDDVRDLADLAYVSSLPAFVDAVRLNTAVAIPRAGPAPRDIVDPAALDRLRHATKIAPRQFHRVVEMYLMQKLAPAVRPSLDEVEGADEAAEAGGGSSSEGKASAAGQAARKAPATPAQLHAYKLWRLFVKQRLYRHNKEILGQLERAQRIDKLEETLRSVELEYARLLSMHEQRARLAAAADKPPSAKRKLEEDAVSNGSKKARVADA